MRLFSSIPFISRDVIVENEISTSKRMCDLSFTSFITPVIENVPKLSISTVWLRGSDFPKSLVAISSEITTEYGLSNVN